ncbi:MAG TPA: permease prefix domain 1-containing protein [Gemmatimonadaceae bacterium]|nr:permease prefix domain 1-containing protein [Gemmatimonadaceae bacterium]
MTTPAHSASLEDQIAQWRAFLRRRQAIHSVDVTELEDHLREQVGALTDRGLSADEAFLVAVKRMGDLDTLSREFAREHSERLWKQLVAPADAVDAPDAARARREPYVAVGLGVLAAVLFKLPSLFGYDLDRDEGFFGRNMSLFVLPPLAAYFAWKRRLAVRTVQGIAAAFVVAAVFANAFPFTPRSAVEGLVVLHLPIALWLAIGVAYAGGRWHDDARRMDFIRFSGELFIYYALIALGGGAITGITAMIFKAAGVDPQHFLQYWMVPCGATGAVLVGAWLVEAKQSVIENMAPVLTRLFTPLLAAVLVAFLGTLLWTGRGVSIEREALIAFDLLLAVVLGLVLYSASARDPQRAPGGFDSLQVVLIASALLVDAVALWAIAARISEFGYTPNRVAALGENVILLVNLTWSLVLYVRFVRGRGTFASLERWQTSYLPVYAAWAAAVVAIFPLLFPAA